ncbi:MAG: DMT family transporter [Bacteroidales bacterium]|nr:DMT family transporter [Bacteroidales bacterium]
MKRKSNEAIILLFVLLLVLIWGSAFILMKKSLEYFPSDILGAWRMLSACVVMLIPAAMTIRKVSLKTFFLITLSGVLANAIPAILFAYAQRGIESYIAGILNSTTTLFTLVLGVVFFKYRANLLNVFGVILGFLAIIGLLAFAGGKSLSFNFSYGVYILIATVLYAINIFFIKRWLSGVSTIALVSNLFLVPGIFAAIYLFGFSDFVDIYKNTSGANLGILYMSLIGVFCSAIALLMYYYLIKIADVIFVASVTYLMPVISTLWGISDGEKLGFMHVLFILLIILSVFMANYNDFFKSKKKVNKLYQE